MLAAHETPWMGVGLKGPFHPADRPNMPSGPRRMRALSIRQPYAELILRGEKTIEYRSRPTRIIGERFYIYAAKGPPEPPEIVGKVNGMPNGAASGHIWPPSILSQSPLTPALSHPRTWEREQELPRGVIVGSAVIADCTRNNGHYEWHLTGVKRYKHPRKPRRHPQPVWFLPF